MKAGHVVLLNNECCILGYVSGYFSSFFFIYKATKTSKMNLFPFSHSVLDGLKKNFYGKLYIGSTDTSASRNF